MVKLGRSKSLRIIVASSLLLTVLMIILMNAISGTVQDLPDGVTVSGSLATTGYSAIRTVISDSQTIVVLISIFCALFICGDFGNRTIGHLVSSGHSRLSVCVSKMLAYLLGALIIAIAYPLFYVLGFTIANGFGKELTGEVVNYIIRSLSLYLLTIIGTASICGMLAFLIRNVGATIGANIGTLMVFAIVIQLTQMLNNKVSEFFTFTPIYQFTKCASDVLTSGEIWTIVLVSVCTFVVTSVISVISFAKRDLA